MKTPHGVAGFDSATGLLRATTLALAGKPFPALGHPPILQYPVRWSDVLPMGARRLVYGAATGFEGISRRTIGKVDMDAIAQWATELHPERRYPAVFVGSSSGALCHLAAALGAAWLPQTFLIGLRRRGGGIDDPQGDLAQARAAGEALLDANPGVQLHQMHDPSQDRLSLRHISYLRTKYRVLPPAYRAFLRERLEPGGTIILSDCTKRWPTRRIDDRYVFQFGAVGGMEPEEYVTGSARVRDYLRYYRAGIERWDPPEADGESPEAEWGFETALRAEIEDLARERGLRLVRLAFEDPEDLSPSVAELHRRWYAERDIPGGRLLVSSFVLTEPWLALRTGSVPYWKTFNSGPSHARLAAYLDSVDPYRDIRLMIFPHGTESVGLPSLDDWRGILRRGRDGGSFVGMNERTYPHHFSALARYHIDIEAIPERYPPADPLPWRRFEQHCVEVGATAARIEEIHRPTRDSAVVAAAKAEKSLSAAGRQVR